MNWVNLFDLAGLKKKQIELEEEMSKPNFWDQLEKAQKVTQEVSNIKKRIEYHESLNAKIEDMMVLLDMAEEEDDQNTLKEVQMEIKSLKEEVEDLELENSPK